MAEHDPYDHPRVDRTVFEVYNGFEEAEASLRRFWHSQTPADRLRHQNFLHRLNFGDGPATRGIQRVLEVVELDRR